MKTLVPEIIQKNPITVLTITSTGDPNHVEKYLHALYGTAYGTKMKVFKPKGISMTLGKLIARWPDAYLKPKDQWIGIWGLPVPKYVTQTDLLQKDPDLLVSVETWEYDEVAQLLYVGSYVEEGPTIDLLHTFIKDSGYKIDGNSHEEEYLTSPAAKQQKTIIRYKIKK